jgi:phage protein U
MNSSPVFKTFRYEGYSLGTKGKMLAALSESGNTYTVEEGECLMGQYCVRRITENQVEIEDVFQKRRQTFTRVQ